MLPDPKWTGNRWTLDLRGFGFGRHWLEAPPPPAGEILAIHAAYALLATLRARPSAQLELLPGQGERRLAEVLDAYLRERKWRSVGGERWTRETCRALGRELGDRPLCAFASVDILWSYRDRVRAKVGPKAAQSRLIVLQQVLRFAASPPRGWLPHVPPFPSPKISPDEVIRQALLAWVDEASFRAARARIYEHQTAKNVLAVELRRAGLPDDAAAVRDIIERRRLYLSFAFYTGMRRHDLDCIDDSYLSPDMEVYFRHGRKTGIEIAPEAICPPFLADIAAELRRLGRAWRPGERIAGGPWKNSCRVIETAARNAGVVKWNLMDCRRSFVYHKASAGVAEADLVRLLGHKDSRMVRAVYLQLAPRLQRDQAGAAWPRHLSSVPGTGGARILRMDEAMRTAPSSGDLAPHPLPIDCQNDTERDG